MKILALTCVILCVGIFTAFGQTQTLEEGQYFRAWRTASDKSGTFSRRTSSTSQAREDGKLRIDEEAFEEYTSSGDLHQTYKRYDKNGSAITEEIVMVGEVYYCRTGTGAWKSSDKWCISSRLSGIPADAKSEFTTEVAGKGKEQYTMLRWYSVFKWNPTEKTRYVDNRTWIDDLGRIYKTESRRGVVGSSEPEYITQKTYTYDEKVKIEAPIN